MIKFLDWLRQSILNSFFYNFILSFTGWASKAVLFSPSIYGTYKVKDENITKTWLYKVATGIGKFFDSWFLKFRTAFFDSFFVTTWLKVHKWLKGSAIYRLLLQFNVIYLLVLYVYVDRFIRNYMIGISSVWDELLMIIFVGCIIVRRILFNKKYVFTTIDIPLGVFILVYLSVMFIYSPDVGIGIEGLRAVVQYTIWYYLVVQMLDSEKVLEGVLFLFVVGVGLLGLHGTYQYFTGAEMLGNWVDSSETIQTRAFSIVGSPNTLGSLMVLNIPVGFGMFLAEKDVLKKIIYLIFTVFMGLGLIFTFSRGAWMAAFVGVLIVFVFVAKRMIVAMVAFGLAVIMGIDNIWNRIYYMFTNEYIAKASTGGRIYRWAYGIEQWKSSKLFGLGVGRFGGAVATNHNLTPFYIDNYYLKTLTESGIIGLGALILLFVTTLRNMFVYIRSTLSPRYRLIMISIFSGVVGIMIHNGVENIFESPFSVVYFWTYIGVLVSMNKIDSRRA